MFILNNNLEFTHYFIGALWEVSYNHSYTVHMPDGTLPNECYCMGI